MGTEVCTRDAEIVSCTYVARTQGQRLVVRAYGLLTPLSISQRRTKLVPQQRILQTRPQYSAACDTE